MTEKNRRRFVAAAFQATKNRGVSGPAAHVFYLNPSRKTSNGPRRYDDDDNDAYNYGDHARQV